MKDSFLYWDLDSIDWLEKLTSNQELTPDHYILKNPGDTLVAEQLHCYPKAEQKFPNWHKPGMVYTKLSLEQSSGELAALYKSTLAVGSELWDLTGGLGMDIAAFALRLDNVHHNEPNLSLSRIARNNHNLMGFGNIRYQNTFAEDLISTISETDTIYLDPSRRSDFGRTFLLKDCTPNAIELLPELKKRAKRVLIKLSPLYDLDRILKELPGTRQIHVVSVSGEVREILAILDDSLPFGIFSVILPQQLVVHKNPSVDCSALSFIHYPETGLYLHSADPAIHKADTLCTYAKSNECSLWGTGGYLTSKSSTIDGSKSYKIQESMVFKPKELRKYLKSKRVNIHKRNFPIEVSSLYKSLSTSMGDDLHLFFTTLDDGSKAVCITEPPTISL